jgi:hypothetical protein
VLPPGGLAYVTRSRLDGDPRPIPARQRLAIRARGISAVTIDARRARTGCSPALDVHADDLLRVRLDGCNVTYAIKRVCHATPVYDVLVRAPPGERPRSLGVTLRGHRVRVRHGKVRIDVRRHPSALAHVRVVSLDPDGRLRVRSTTHRWCPGR